MRARLSILALVLTVAFAAPAAFLHSGEDTGLRPSDREAKIAKAICSMLDRLHLLPQAVDDVVAERTFNSFVDRLDSQKVYFLASDIEEFKANLKSIDDWTKAGNLDFPFRMFERFLQRVDERVAQIDVALEMQHDFTVEETVSINRDDSPWAKNSEELADEWRRRVKYFLLDKLTAGETYPESVKQLQQRYHNFQRRMKQTDNDELLEMFLSSLSTSFDPHSTYMSPSTLENFEINMRLELEGIGAALQSIDGYTVVSQIIPGGAAARDGRLKPEDKIVAVAQGKDGDFSDLVDLKLNDVVKQIRGEKGTIVRLRIKRVGSEPFIIKLVRSKVELKDREAQGEVFEQGTKPDGSPYRLGVIDLPSFYMDMDASRRRNGNYKSTTRDVLNIIQRFQLEGGVDGIVLDLRANGGGALQESLSLTGLFIDEGPVVQIKDAGGEVDALDDPIAGVAWDGPLLVLTSRFSASASEIFAGAIQDYRRGLVVGDVSSHGKGTVQTLEDVGRRVGGGWLSSPKMGALKITKQQFYRPNGDSTQNRGVIADVVLPSVANHSDLGEANYDYAVPFDQVPAAPFEPEEWVTPKIVQDVKERSKGRRAKNDEWNKVETNIARYTKFKDRKEIPISRDAFLSEFNEMQDDDTKYVVQPIEEPKDGSLGWRFAKIGGSEDEENAGEAAASDDEPKIERDFYLDEVMSIFIDFMNLQSGPKLAQ
ncbi:MAG: carboxy terminal-processing peptidase [Planctomycetota bacterium]